MIAISGLCLIALMSIAVLTVPYSHATSTYNVNAIRDPGFEDTNPTSLCTDPSRCTWVGDLYDDGNYQSTITLDNNQALTGLQSAKLDVSQNATAIKTNTTTAGFLHITMYQTQENSTMNTVSNVTDRPDSFSIWFYIQPKASGFSMFEIRIRSYSSSELDYFFVNPILGNPASNSTNNSEGGTPTKGYLLPTPPIGQWVHLQRNLYQDWTTPMILPNRSYAPGLRLDDSIQRIEFDALFSINNPTTGAILAETVWIDNVVLYHNSIYPPPLPPPSNYWAAFNFEDINGNNVTNLVQWRLFNSTGLEVVGYTRGDASLTLEPYTVAVYYPVTTGQNPEPYQIFTQRITTLNSTIVLPLEMFPLTISPWSYVAFNNTLAAQNLRIKTQNITTLSFEVLGNKAPTLIIVGVRSSPIVVIGNDNDPKSLPWSYDPNLSVVRIPTPTLGNFSIFLTAPVLVPRIAFQDITGAPVTDSITWKVFDAQGNYVTSQPGSYLETGLYTFRAYYDGYLLYSSPLTTTPTTIRLEMVRIGAQGAGYIALNATAKSITITNMASQLQFTIDGQGPFLIVIKVPSRPITLEREGVAITDWTYNATTNTLAIQTAQAGTFTVIYSVNTSISPLLLGEIVGGVLIAASVTVGIFLLRRKNRPAMTTDNFSTQVPKQVDKPKVKRGSKKGLTRTFSGS